MALYRNRLNTSVAERVRMSERNRSEGWQFAKTDGHKNEEQLGVILRESPELTNLLHDTVFSAEQKHLPEVIVDGSKHVPSILGDHTVSKIDINLVWVTKQLGLSVKKSDGGQVWLIGLDRFLNALAKKTGQKVPQDVELVLSLFIGGQNLTNFSMEFAQGLRASANDKYHDQEVHQNRLVLESIKKIQPEALATTFDFLKKNLSLVTELSFFNGLASNAEDCAELVIYNHVHSGRNVFSKTELLAAMESSTNQDLVTPGDRNGGSTIKLPTGFLQMHKPQGSNLLQFHHNYEKVLNSIAAVSQSPAAKN